MLTPQSAIDNWGRDDETKIDSLPVNADPARHPPARPAGLIAVKPISGHRTLFWQRMRAMWDWFWLSMTMIGYIFLILAGGLTASKLLIMIWEGLLRGYFS